MGRLFLIRFLFDELNERSYGIKISLSSTNNRKGILVEINFLYKKKDFHQHFPPFANYLGWSVNKNVHVKKNNNKFTSEMMCTAEIQMLVEH